MVSSAIPQSRRQGQRRHDDVDGDADGDGPLTTAQMASACRVANHDVALHRHGHRQPGRHAHRHAEDEVGVRVQVAVGAVADGVVGAQEQDTEKVEKVVDELDGVGDGQCREEGVGRRPHVALPQHDEGQNVA